ncbi:MAG: glycosyltransferase family 4 protein [Deltaproteobacteria bacterium]|nr:glycosyltransferase family 4 protein [Deltaproteobacteria bacterium]MBW2152341.1 glycosyltransferase family 4 protein [Deltaproteobacteria bacterium]
MRIGVNTLFFIPGEVGGTETYLRNTLRCMAKLYPEIGLVLFSNRENHPVLKSDLSSFCQVEFQLLNFPAGNRYMRIIREQTELPVRVCRARIDVLWSPGYTAPFFSPCPQVTTIHDMQYRRHPEDLSLLARLATHVLVTAAARRSCRIITQSEFSKKEILRFTGVPSHKVYPILLAASPEFAEDPEISNAVVHNYDDPHSKKPYILSVANSYPHKNLHTLVEAFGKITDRCSHNLVLIGLPRMGEKKLQDSINRIPGKNRIIRIDRASTEELIAWYRSADLFVFPSLYEGFGLPVLEAMMAGTPVVTTKMGSIPEVGGEHVVYADPPDARTIAGRILEVLDWERTRRHSWVAAARAHASKFTWEETARKTLEVLRRGAGKS